MADTEYIEINSSEVREDSTKMSTEQQAVNTEGINEDAPSMHTDPDVDISANSKATEEAQAPILLPDLVAGGEIQKTEDSKENVSNDTEEPQEQACTPLDSLSEESAISNGNDNEPFEVIDDAEEQAVGQDAEEEKAQEKNEKEEESSGATETIPTVAEDKLSSPFQRFRAMSKPSEKKEGSSITFPSIFSDISTSFMSLKSLGKRKESPSDGTPLKDINGDSTTTPSPGSTSTSNSSTVEQLRVERKNLLGMAKLSIKGLIESSLSAGHILDSDHAPLQQFFIIMEAVLRHGLKSPKHIFAGNKQFWGPLEAIEKIADEAAEITNSVRELPGIKTHIGRARAWLRLALMQKRLSDYFRMMVEHRDIMKEFYEPESLVLSEEGIVLSGHLVGLNCIDANLCMKGDDLDNQNAVIDYSLYIRDGNRLSISSESDVINGSQEEMKTEQEDETMEDKIQELANQKNYLEERNRYLETTLTELQKRSGETSTSNQALETELDAAKISLTALQEERQRLLDEKENMTVTHRKILHDRQADLDMERETLVQSRAGLDDMLAQVKKQLKHETQMRMEVERELELQISLKQELEVAMKLLEKDIYSKQDSLVILREQLDNVKAINIDIYKKLQDKADAVEAKGKAITDLEDETKRLTEEVGKLKEKISEGSRQLDVALERADRYAQNLDDSEKRRNALETNLQIEREWRKALELQVEKSGSKITQLETELSMMQLLRQELNEVKNERDELRATCEEQESTISDLADHLGKSKQNFQDLKDVHKSFADKTWEKDKEVKSCAQCEKPFSLARRKHHCRNCGQIFCNTCSDNTMPLASSAKPVRVCDSCHTVLLQRYSAATP